jgi:hypothetical protein
MSRTAYPMAADLAARLLECPTVTLELVNGINLQSKCERSRREFEGATGRRFIPVQQTRPYRWTGNSNGFLSLNADLVSVTSLTVGGTAYTQGVDYELWPMGADLDGLPFTMVRFLNKFIARDAAISINALWGMPSFEEDAFGAMLDGAALLCVPEMSLNVSNGLTKSKEGDTEYTYGNSNTVPFQKESATWQMTVDDGKQRYTKVAVGLG